MKLPLCLLTATAVLLMTSRAVKAEKSLWQCNIKMTGHLDGLVGTCWARLGTAVAAGVGSGFAFPTLQWGVRNLSFHVQLSTSPPHPSDNCYSNGAVCVWFSLAPLSLLDLSSLWQQVFLLIVVGTAYKGKKEESKQSCWAFQSSVHTVCGFERTISCYFRWRW